MDTFYLIITVILFALAISDLIVGVSNDAVNFLNSAIGAKAAKRRTIMIIASLGVLFGATFSSGMMEVARKGIFHPDMFLFSEIMIIFLAVMITDVILLDLFNTFGLPTSTTVSIVFELLGAAVAVSLLKIWGMGGTAYDLSVYINSSKALAIISGILLSIVVSFTAGVFFQYLTRLVFTFKYDKQLRRWGAIWGGFSISAITFFILLKGIGGASFLTTEMAAFIKGNTFKIILISFVSWTVLLQFLRMIIHLDIPRTIVLIGTFALAMAFAGNDLVNFIGVPLAGFRAFQELINTPGALPDTLLMTVMKGKVSTPTIFLLLAGLIMVITLWFSKKAQSVTKTEVNLGRQDEGYERFGSSALSRSIVRGAISLSQVFRQIIPAGIHRRIDRRFKPMEEVAGVKIADKPAFDMIRAAVNLTLASIIISFATSLKLPLSTTYVTFMVAMGSSLADRAWGRESAVYRITGVFTVVGGWFMTALIAFLVSFTFAVTIHFGGGIGITILLILAFYFIYRTYVLHNQKVKTEEESVQNQLISGEMVNQETLVTIISQNIVEVLETIQSVFSNTIIGLKNEDRKILKNAKNEVHSLSEKTKSLRDNISKTIQQLEMEAVESGHFYVQELDNLREIVTSLKFITEPSYTHINNNHKGLIAEQVNELNNLNKEINKLFDIIQDRIQGNNFDQLESIEVLQQEILEGIEKIRRKQVKRIKQNIVGTKNSLLYLSLLNEAKNILLHINKLLKSQRDFINQK
ncbi:MAG TPA: phosphate permease [Candidatus Marinimicrobia bacterium]|nr:phosphate permease [Candidatus Neomarinimicrobiota bacterium]